MPLDESRGIRLTRIHPNTHPMTRGEAHFH